MRFHYYSGQQEIQRDAILECGGSVDNYAGIPNARRVEADYLVAAAEERAKAVSGCEVRAAILGTVYTIIYT